MASPMITIQTSDEVLRNYGNQIGAIGEGEAHKAFARAINRVTKTVESRVVRAVAKQSSIKVAVIRRSIKTQLVSPNIRHGHALEGKVIATGRPIPLKDFGAKQFSWGVRARVWGRVQRFPGTFIFSGTYRSGKPVGSGHVFHRLTRDSNPIEVMYGPSVPEEMIRDESARVFHQTVGSMLPARISHEIQRLLPR